MVIQYNSKQCNSSSKRKNLIEDSDTDEKDLKKERSIKICLDILKKEQETEEVMESEEVIEIQSSFEQNDVQNLAEKFNNCRIIVNNNIKQSSIGNIKFLAREKKILCMDIVLLRKDLLRLYPGEWFNDKLINAYFKILGKKYKTHKLLTTYFIETVFLKTESSTDRKKVQLDYSELRNEWKNYDGVLMPLHMHAHWILLHFCFEELQIFDSNCSYYDEDGNENIKVHKIKRLIKEIFKKKLITKVMRKIPMQQNGNDCGVFACYFAHKILEEGEFERINMDRYREHIAKEIVLNSVSLISKK